MGRTIEAFQLLRRSLAAAVLLLALSVAVFWIRVRQLPSIDADTRRYQIAASYFLHPSQVNLLTTVLARSSRMSSTVAFERDIFFEELFSLEEIGQSAKTPYDNRLMIFDDVDMGAFTPLLSFTWPLVNSYTIGWPSGPRLYDVTLVDLDADGIPEIVVSWMTYPILVPMSNDDDQNSVLPILSEGVMYPLVIHFSGSGEPTFAGFLGLTKEKSGRYVAELPEKITIEVNGVQREVPIMSVSTDVFWTFQNVDQDPRPELIMAFPVGDGSCHYCPQGWRVAVFEFQNGTFVADPEFRVMEIPKSRGLGLADIHGYGFTPMLGELVHFLSPSWLNVPDSSLAWSKRRFESAAIKELDATRAKAKHR